MAQIKMSKVVTVQCEECGLVDTANWGTYGAEAPCFNCDAAPTQLTQVSTENQNNEKLYIHDDGSITCVNHAPFSVKPLLEQSPNKRTHWTPRGTWAKATKQEREYFKSQVGIEMQCETCCEATQKELTKC